MLDLTPPRHTPTLHIPGRNGARYGDDCWGQPDHDRPHHQGPQPGGHHRDGLDRARTLSVGASAARTIRRRGSVMAADTWSGEGGSRTASTVSRQTRSASASSIDARAEFQPVTCKRGSISNAPSSQIRIRLAERGRAGLAGDVVDHAMMAPHQRLGPARSRLSLKSEHPSYSHLEFVQIIARPRPCPY